MSVSSSGSGPGNVSLSGTPTEYLPRHRPPPSAPQRISLLPVVPPPAPLPPAAPPPQSYTEPPPFKKIRLAPTDQPPPTHTNTQTMQMHLQPLRVDTREPPNSYATESMSPVLGNELTVEDQNFRTTKDELLQQIAKVDRDIALSEQTLAKLKKKEAELEVAASKPASKTGGVEAEAEAPRSGGRGNVHSVYAENRRKAISAHAILAGLAAPTAPGLPPYVPIYNQPQDTDVYRENRVRHALFRRRLAECLQQKRLERDRQENAHAAVYSRRQADWLRRIERIESGQKRKAKDAKNREFFEKVFPELRKQREDRERFNRVGSRIKSDADLEEIMDGLQEQELEDKKMRSYAVVPPLLLDAKARKDVYIDTNGVCADMEAEYKERRILNIWTSVEREIFKEKYLQHPKNFCAVASFLERKSVQDCVQFYYLSKKTENYKQLLRKSRQRTRASRNPQKAAVAAAVLAEALTAGVMTRQQREQQQKTGKANVPPLDPLAISHKDLALAAANKDDASPDSKLGAVPVPAALSPSVNLLMGEVSLSPERAPPSPGLPPEPPPPAPRPEDMGPGRPENASSTPPPGSSPSSLVIADTSDVPPVLDVTVSCIVSSASSVVTVTQDLHPLEEVKSESPSATPSVAVTTSATTAVTSADPNDNSVSNCSPLCGTPAPALAAAVPGGGACAAGVVPSVTCAVCGEQPAVRPLSRARAALAGLDIAELGHARICLHCHYKTVRSRYTRCPVSTCPVPIVRTKQLRHLPPQWLELSSEIKEPVITEFRIPPNMTKCCLSCFKRIARRLAPHIEIDTDMENDIDPRFNDDEIEKLKSLLREHGSNWQIISDTMLKSINHVKSFYYNFRKKYGLDAIVIEYNKLKYGEDIRPVISDDDFSGSSTTSCDEHTSETASIDSPTRSAPHIQVKLENDMMDEVSLEPTVMLSNANSSVLSPGIVHNQAEEKPLRGISLPPLPTLSTLPSSGTTPQTPAKIVITKDEYDSSATETADEENESPTTRQSPKVLQIQSQTQQMAQSQSQSLYPTQTTITVVPGGASQHNGPLQNLQVTQPRIENTSGTSPLTVRDVMLNVIEMSLLKNSSAMPPQANNSGKVSATIIQNKAESRGDITFVREYRPEQANSINKSSLGQSISIHRQGAESLATLSVVNSHGHSQSNIHQPQIVHSPQRAATITPVNPSMPQQQDVSKDGIVVVQIQQRQQDEPQTLDLSIKKPRDQSFGGPPPPAHTKTIHSIQHQPNSNSNQPPSVTLYRTPEPIYIGYHPSSEQNRPTKSPSVYVSAVPISQHSLQPITRGQGAPSPVSQVKISKATTRLSPKIGHGPKGSITHGTPVNTAQQNSAGLSPHFDGILRRTPPETKVGSITQGTPVHLPTHHLQDKRTYDYYSGKRQSPGGPYPASPAPQAASPSGGAAFASPSPYSRPPSYGLEQRQIIYADYITSQQMHGAAHQRRTGQEAPAIPSSSASAPSSAGRHQYLSARSSPAEHHNSSPSPGSAPSNLPLASAPAPPQRREGVIQRHNTAPPPPSSHHHYPPPGHEAFSSLVDVAVQQPSLPVPRTHHKEEPSHLLTTTPVSSAPLQTTHEKSNHLKHQDSMRYQQERLIQRDIAMQQQHQIHHQQQMQRHQAAVFDSQRRVAAHHQYQERLDRERERERDRHIAIQQERDRDRQVAAALHQQQQQQAERDRQMAVVIERHRQHHQHTLMQHHQQQQQMDRHHQQPQNIEDDRVRHERDRDRERDAARLLVGSFSTPQHHQTQHTSHHPPPQRHMERQNERPNNIAQVNAVTSVSSSGTTNTGSARHSNDGTLTAASLIDAIITHQINQTSGEPSRDTPRGQFSYHRESHHPTNMGNNTTVTVQQNPDQRKPTASPANEGNGEQSSHLAAMPSHHIQMHQQAHTKSITLGELTDSIIAKDFSNPGQQPTMFGAQRYNVTSSYQTTNSASLANAPSPEPSWKRRLPEEERVGPRQPAAAVPPPASQPVSAKHMPYVEPVSPPDHHHTINRVSLGRRYGPASGGGGTAGGTASVGGPASGTGTQQQHLSAFDYVKSRIVEVMRTEDEGKRERSSTPAEMVIDETPPPPSIVTTFAPSAYAYPYSALNVPSAAGATDTTVPPPAPPPQPSVPVVTPASEPKPLMSAQYEPLSDED